LTGLGKDEFRALIGRFATGVVVVTANDEAGARQGMTVNSLTSVSLEPPTLLVCLTRETRTAAAVERSGKFAVSILGHVHKELSTEFARPGGERDASGYLATTASGLPVVPRTLGHLECEVERLVDGNDHVIVIGRVLAGEQAPGDPLIFFGGRYARHIAYEDYPAPDWWG